MEKKKIIVVECLSSSANYIKDIIDEGYEPILMEIQCPKTGTVEYRMPHDLCIKDFFTDLYPNLAYPKIVEVPDNYEETLEIVKKISPSLIIPGSDDGIIFATKLSYDLGLPCNKLENLPKMKNKSICQQTLKEAGIRSIRGKVVSSIEEAEKFFDELGNGKIVIKPISGGASVGVHICESKEMFEKAFKEEIAKTSNQTGIAGSLLLQEYIDGVEYIVNTVSCRGKHKITAVMEYKKRLVSGKARVYETMSIISPEIEISKKIIEYDLKMLDAIGITYGPVHTEIMVDEKGPVLIEINCRPCGALMRAMWLDQVLGNHETNVSLQAYLHPDDFLNDTRDILMCGEKCGVIKNLSIDKDIYVKKNLCTTAFSDIEGVVYALGMGDERMYGKTVDLATASGMVYIAHQDKEIIKKALNEIEFRVKTKPETIYITD